MGWGGSLCRDSRDAGIQAESQEAELRATPGHLAAGRPWAGAWPLCARGPRLAEWQRPSPGAAVEKATHREEGPEEAPHVSPQVCALSPGASPLTTRFPAGLVGQVSCGPRATVSTPWDHSIGDSGRTERRTDRECARADSHPGTCLSG